MRYTLMVIIFTLLPCELVRQYIMNPGPVSRPTPVATATVEPVRVTPERVAPVHVASTPTRSSSSSSYRPAPSPRPTTWSDADQNALEGAVITKMILEQQGYDSQTANDVAIRTWAFD